MKIIAFSILLLFTLFAPLRAEMVSSNIFVKVQGEGKTEEEALKNAFKKAVYKAVGVYVLSETTLENENLQEKIFLNSDAVVTSHKVLQSEKKDDQVVVVIEAEVIKNAIAEKVKEYQNSQAVSQTHIISAVNTLEAIDNATKTFRSIMADFPQSIIDVVTLGDPFVDEKKGMVGDEVFMIQNIRISVNYNRYTQLTSKLTKLLTPFAKGHSKGIWYIGASGYIDYWGWLESDKMSKLPDNIVCFLYRRTATTVTKKQKPSYFMYDAYKLPENLAKQLFNDQNNTSSIFARAMSNVNNNVSEYISHWFNIDYSLYGQDNQLLFSDLFVVNTTGKDLCLSNIRNISSDFTEYGGITPLYVYHQQRGILMPHFACGFTGFVDAQLHFSINKSDLQKVREAKIKATKFGIPK